MRDVEVEGACAFTKDGKAILKFEVADEVLASLFSVADPKFDTEILLHEVDMSVNSTDVDGASSFLFPLFSSSSFDVIVTNSAEEELLSIGLAPSSFGIVNLSICLNKLFKFSNILDFSSRNLFDAKANSILNFNYSYRA